MRECTGRGNKNNPKRTRDGQGKEPCRVQTSKRSSHGILDAPVAASQHPRGLYLASTIVWLAAQPGRHSPDVKPPQYCEPEGY